MLRNQMRVYEGNFVVVDRVEVDRQRAMDIVRTKNGKFTVVLLVINRDTNQALFVHQVRIAAINEFNPTGEVVEACAGRIEHGQSKEKTAARELFEELGAKVAESDVKWMFGGQPMYLSPGVLDEMAYFGYVELSSSQLDSSKEVFGLAHEGEVTRRAIINVNALGDMWFTDAKTQLITLEFRRLKECRLL